MATTISALSHVRNEHCYNMQISIVLLVTV